MDATTVRAHAEAQCEALLASDIDRAFTSLSSQLRQNMGEVIAQLPLPISEATVESVELAGSGYLAVLRLVGEGSEVTLETRWKDRDGVPTIVEVSHTAAEIVEPVEEATEEGTAPGS